MESLSRLFSCGLEPGSELKALLLRNSQFPRCFSSSPLRRSQLMRCYSSSPLRRSQRMSCFGSSALRRSELLRCCSSSQSGGLPLLDHVSCDITHT